MGPASDEGRDVSGGAGAGEPGVVLRRPRRRCRVHPAVDTLGNRRPREHPEDRCVRPRSDPPIDHRHADRLVSHEAADAVHGQGHAVAGPGVVVVPVVPRGLPGLQGHRRPGGTAALHRRPPGRGATRAVPRGRAQVRPDRATALRRRRLRRPEGRRADRPSRHRWIGTGDAQGLAVHLPAQVPRHRRPGDHRTPGRRAAASRAPSQSAKSLQNCTPRCSACSTRLRRSAQRSRPSGRRRATPDRRRRRPHEPSASTAAAPRRRRWRCPDESQSTGRSSIRTARCCERRRSAPARRRSSQARWNSTAVSADVA